MNLRRSLGWAFSQELLTFALQFVGSLVMARLLTPAEFGVFALAMAASYLLSYQPLRIKSEQLNFLSTMPEDWLTTI